MPGTETEINIYIYIFLIPHTNLNTLLSNIKKKKKNLKQPERKDRLLYIKKKLTGGISKATIKARRK